MPQFLTDPFVIAVLVGGFLVGILIRRLWQARGNKERDRLRAIEQAAIEESRKAERREDQSMRRANRRRRRK